MITNNKSLSGERMKIYRKYGLKPTIVVKTGAGIILSNAPRTIGGKENEKINK